MPWANGSACGKVSLQQLSHQRPLDTLGSYPSSCSGWGRRAGRAVWSCLSREGELGAVLGPGLESEQGPKVLGAGRGVGASAFVNGTLLLLTAPRLVQAVSPGRARLLPLGGAVTSGPAW